MEIAFRSLMRQAHAHQAVRPAMLYGSECWAAKKQHEQKLHTNEMKMLRWAGGVTLLDKIQNQRVRGSFGVAPIVEKLTESRLRLYEHIMRRPAKHMVRKTLEIDELPRRPGRPKTTWMARVRRGGKSRRKHFKIGKYGSYILGKPTPNRYRITDRKKKNCDREGKLGRYTKMSV